MNCIFIRIFPPQFQSDFCDSPFAKSVLLLSAETTQRFYRLKEPITHILLVTVALYGFSWTHVLFQIKIYIIPFSKKLVVQIYKI